MKISLKKDKTSTEVQINVEFDPSTLIESAQHYHRDANMTVVAQGVLRNMLKGTKTINRVAPHKLQAACDKLNWVKIFTPHARKTINEKMADVYASLDVEDKIQHLVSMGVELDQATSIVSAQHKDAA